MVDFIEWMLLDVTLGWRQYGSILTLGWQWRGLYPSNTPGSTPSAASNRIASMGKEYVPFIFRSESNHSRILQHPPEGITSLCGYPGSPSASSSPANHFFFLFFIPPRKGVLTNRCDSNMLPRRNRHWGILRWYMMGEEVFDFTTVL
jgi:hypothetical protein